MDPQSQFCPNEHCTARGLRGQGTIRIHSQKEGRYRCTTCRGTFSPTTGTAFFGLRTPATVVTTVVTLLAHGCPRQAIVAAFGLDERTVAAWQERAGAQCQRVHTHLVQAGQVDLQHVQADEIYVKVRTPVLAGYLIRWLTGTPTTLKRQRDHSAQRPCVPGFVQGSSHSV